MKKIIIPSLMALLVVAPSCSKSGAKSPEVLSPAQVQVEVSRAFAKSSGESGQAAAGCVAALQSQDALAAFAEIQRIKAQTGLTPEQRAAVSKAMQTTLNQLQTAAQKGDAAARDAIHLYISTR